MSKIDFVAGRLQVNGYEPTIPTTAYSVVLLSIIMQVLTIKPLVEPVVRRGAAEDLN